MKTRGIWLAAAALAAAVGGYAATRRWVCRDGRTDLQRLRDVSHLARVLDLRPEQTATLEALQKNLCAHLAVSCARHCACRGDLAAVLTADPFDPARARAVREALCQAYADSEMATMEHIRSIRDALDERQRATFDRMIVEAFQRPCGVCAAGGCACETTGP